LTVLFGHVSERTILFDGTYVADELSFSLKLAGFLFVAVVLLYSRAYLQNRDILRGEYYVLALTALLGIFVLVSANSLVTVYLGGGAGGGWGWREGGGRSGSGGGGRGGGEVLGGGGVSPRGRSSPVVPSSRACRPP